MNESQSAWESVQLVVNWLQTKFPTAFPVETIVVLGSGLGGFAETLEYAEKIGYQDIPGFPQSLGHVQGHSGTLFLATLASGKKIACLQGRFHYYEGHAMAETVIPIRVLNQLGAKTLVVTNASGGINLSFKAGTLMLMTDHINLMGTNPLLGQNDERFGPRFPDMSEAYDVSLRQQAKSVAQAEDIFLAEGVYCALSGPNYETPAEIRMLRMLGADAVGMSTVPEVLAAKHSGMKILGISCITNAASGVEEGHVLNHEEVLETAQIANVNMTRLLSGILQGS